MPPSTKKTDKKRIEFLADRDRRAREELLESTSRAHLFGGRYRGREVTFQLPRPIYIYDDMISKVTVRQGMNVDAIDLLREQPTIETLIDPSRNHWIDMMGANIIQDDEQTATLQFGNNQRLLTLIRDAFSLSGGVYGYRPVHGDLNEIGETCGKNRMGRIMQLNRIKTLRGYKVPRRIAGRPLVVAPYRVQRPFTVVRANQGWLYLAAVIDLFDRNVAGWSMKPTLLRELALVNLTARSSYTQTGAAIPAASVRKPLNRHRSEDRIWLWVWGQSTSAIKINVVK
ncbi:hypothetical protein RF11_11426 [Thelohanellus kitauei]|uniref:HTH-like domain-containing protein n=1 Tax=Thelohanellus kitauei TaxID=669202 RepID=A0A0C2JA37_THEKT|nr:hypothetical protein RF11_11426 [Thelohanellus kitauei]